MLLTRRSVLKAAAVTAAGSAMRPLATLAQAPNARATAPNDKRFPSPLEVYDAVKGLDRRIGLCMDIGHTFRMHEDLVADVKKTHDRLYSMHFKDLDSDHIDAKGVPVGTGVLPIIPLLRELVRSGYKEEIQLEYEVEAKDPLPGMAESLGFMRGVLQSMP